MRLTLLLYLVGLTCPGYSGTLLLLQVAGLDDRPITGVIISAKDESSTSPPSDIAGKTQLALVGDLGPGESLGLVLVRAPSKNLRFYSPWGGTAIVPQHGKSVSIVLGVLGDRSALRNARAVDALAKTVTSRLRENSITAAPVPKLRILTDVSKEVGLNPVDVDLAIRSLGNRTGPFNDLGPGLGNSVKDYVAIMPSSQEILKFEGIA